MAEYVVVARKGYGGMEPSVINLAVECFLVCAIDL